MFKDLKDGSTHYQNDGCGCPEHNDPQEKQSKQWKITSDGTLTTIVVSKNKPNVEEHIPDSKLVIGENVNKEEGVDMFGYIEKQSNNWTEKLNLIIDDWRQEHDGYMRKEMEEFICQTLDNQKKQIEEYCQKIPEDCETPIHKIIQYLKTL